jgi:two-component sensor histidine kinase
VRLTWIESGGPPVNAAPDDGFGMRLIRGLVEREIGGAADIRFDPDGLTCALRIPPPAERAPARFR